MKVTLNPYIISWMLQKHMIAIIHIQENEFLKNPQSKAAWSWMCFFHSSRNHLKEKKKPLRPTQENQLQHVN